MRALAPLWIALSICCASCQVTKSEPQITSYLAGGQVDEKAIVTDVEKALGELSRGIAENDADQIFSVFSTTRKTTYIRKGEIVESVGEARERYAKAFAEFTSKRRFSFEEKQFDILDERTVLFAGLGVIESKQAEEPWRIAYTILWSLEPAGWKAIHMHISW